MAALHGYEPDRRRWAWRLATTSGSPREQVVLVCTDELDDEPLPRRPLRRQWVRVKLKLRGCAGGRGTVTDNVDGV